MILPFIPWDATTRTDGNGWKDHVFFLFFFLFPFIIFALLSPLLLPPYYIVATQSPPGHIRSSSQALLVRPHYVRYVPCIFYLEKGLSATRRVTRPHPADTFPWHKMPQHSNRVHGERKGVVKERLLQIVSVTTQDLRWPFRDERPDSRYSFEIGKTQEGVRGRDDRPTPMAWGWSMDAE